jgi:hypothetical protein
MLQFRGRFPGVRLHLAEIRGTDAGEDVTGGNTLARMRQYLDNAT